MKKIGRKTRHRIKPQKLGRKPMLRGDARDTFLHIRVTQKEHLKLTKKAEQFEVPVSTWARCVLLDGLDGLKGLDHLP